MTSRLREFVFKELDQKREGEDVPKNGEYKGSWGSTTGGKTRRGRGKGGMC